MMWMRRRGGLRRILYRVVHTRLDEVDQVIQQHTQNWKIERMAVVDRNLLRVAVGEMLSYPKTPGPIIINESLEIARRYAAPESVNFLNGVLDAVSRDLLKKRLG